MTEPMSCGHLMLLDLPSPYDHKDLNLSGHTYTQQTTLVYLFHMSIPFVLLASKGDGYTHTLMKS